MYAGGMVQALEELGLSSGVFDAVYGTSAGALNGAWFLSGRVVPGMRTWTDPDIMRGTVYPARMLRGRPAFDLRWLVHQVYEGIEPMDFPAILANPTTFHPVATDIRTGLAVDLHPHIVDQATLQTALRASAGLPILAGPPVALGSSLYFDGGLAESVPIRLAVRDGATHSLILRTRRLDEHRPPASRLHQIVGGGYLRLRAPGAYRAWLARTGQQGAEDRFTAALTTAALQIHPPPALPISTAPAAIPTCSRRPSKSVGARPTPPSAPSSPPRESTGLRACRADGHRRKTETPSDRMKSWSSRWFGVASEGMSKTNWVVPDAPGASSNE